MPESKMYESWSKEELIRKLVEYDKIFKHQQSNAPETDAKSGTSTLEIKCAETSSSLTIDDTSSTPTKRKKIKKDRPFDMSKYSQRQIALRIAYLGWEYSGFAAQNDEAATRQGIKTVEGELINALMAARLIEGPTTCNFSRCGRTDKGVSGFGQVVSVRVRSNLSTEEINGEGGEGKVVKPLVDDNATAEEAMECDVKYTEPKKEEINYIEILNRLLPSDIRVISWAAVPPDFNARFDCHSRTYRYYFPRGKLDIIRMQNAASHFLGTHDFRNFCKLDGSKQITNYHRTVLEIDIRPVSIDPPGGGEFFELHLRGTAFLWHQVRCMMAVLFLVGQGLEEPEIVGRLLDVENTPARPHYEMASELPLVLYDCEFKEIQWQYMMQQHQKGVALSHQMAPFRLYRLLEEQWNANSTRSLLYASLLDQISDQITTELGGTKDQRLPELVTDREPTTIMLGGGRTMALKRYVPLLERPTCDSAETVAAKYNAKRARLNND
ncbi:uncharacterized protein VTP21DRAFT_6678 [Calcarisporiella thermophila]|uniref:uncharacterized protein n=1 Tax=Calcarisporiella thermophila TaxID=911321 RepID=UPI003742A8A2